MGAATLVLLLAVSAQVTQRADVSPGDGLTLAPVHVEEGAPALVVPRSSPRPGPAMPPALGTALLAAGAAAGRRMMRRRRRPDDDPVFVFVHGHGGTHTDFDDLIERMSLPPEQVRVFDYRYVWADPDEHTAALWAKTDRAAEALHAFIGAVGQEHDNVYLVGFSKGGAVITEMLADWDEQPRRSVRAVRGAALLDPPIATGAHGMLQRLGYFVGEVADNGGFDPSRCSWLACRDVRSGLGSRSGVAVLAIRNPKAVLTNFRDLPPGLRVYDLADPGPAAFSDPSDLSGAFRRMSEAHNAPLHSDEVAECLLAEASDPGSCGMRSARQERPQVFVSVRPPGAPRLR